MDKARLKLLDRAMGKLKRLLPSPGKCLPDLQNQDVQDILVIKLSAMGDVLCLMPSLRVLQRELPGARITWLTTGKCNPGLFRNLKFIYAIWIIDTSVWGVLRFFLTVVLRKRFDLVIDFDQYYHTSEALSHILGKGKRVGFATGAKGRLYTSAVQYCPEKNEKLMFYDLVLAALGKGQSADLSLETTILDLVDQTTLNHDKLRLLCSPYLANRPILAFYAGSGANATIRRWPLERYLLLAQYYAEKHYNVFFVGGPEELSMKEVISKRTQAYPGIRNLIGELTLQELAFLLGKVDLFVGNDAGILHLAESQGTRCIGIFGPNLGSKWGPLSTNSRALEKDLECRPCIINFRGQIPRDCPFEGVPCLEAIEVQDVVDVIDDLMGDQEMEEEIYQEVQESIEAKQGLRQMHIRSIKEIIHKLETTLKGGGKIIFVGNGGSAADAQHLAAELVGRFKLNRRALPAVALTTDSSILTAVGNDFGFEDVFARQVEALVDSRDALVAISTSGNSPNIIAAMKMARDKGATVALLTGKDGGKAAALADIVFPAPSDNTPRIQEIHITVGHIVCRLLEKRLCCGES